MDNKILVKEKVLKSREKIINIFNDIGYEKLNKIINLYQKNDL